MKNFLITAIVMGVILVWLAVQSYAGNPGGHYVAYSWTDAGATGTYNYYRSTTPGSCGTGKTPYVTGITTTAYEDDTVVAGTTYYAAFTNVPATGGESNCSTELQISVSSASGSTPTLPSGQAH
jgi:fibronectin type 3 domain-containing protein